MPSKRESSARADYVPALCTHRPSLLPIEWLSEAFGPAQSVGNDAQSWKVGQTWSFRGSKSRNKVSVGEPAEGSFSRWVFWAQFSPTLVNFKFYLAGRVHPIGIHVDVCLPSFSNSNFEMSILFVNEIAKNFQQRISWFWLR